MSLSRALVRFKACLKIVIFGVSLLVVAALVSFSCSKNTNSGGSDAGDGGGQDTGDPTEVNGCDCGSSDENAPCLGTEVSYTLSGDGSLPASTVSFEFECDGGPCACGIFANEYDYWVAPITAGGEVRIVSMTPQATGQADESLRNGWVANPSAVETSTFMDGRLGEMTNTGLPLNPTDSDPFTVDTSTQQVTTIVKSHSILETGEDSCGGTDDTTGLSRHCFWQAAVLTVLDQTPANAGTTVFRPPLTGPEKPLFPLAGVDFSLLPNLPRPTRADGTQVDSPTWEEAVALMGPPKVEWGAQGNWSYWQYMPPMYNYAGNPSGYPPRSTAPLLDAMQLLAIDETGHEDEKRLLAIRSIQMGLDYYFMWKANGYGALYRPNGGHAVGRYLAPLVAAALIGGSEGSAMKADMARVNNGTADRCGFDISGEIHHWTDTDRVLYGYYNIPGCDGYNDYTVQTNSNYVDPGHMGDNGRLTENEDNDFDDVNSCFGAYQAITAGPAQSTANLARAVPAIRTIAFEHLTEYAARMFDHGAYCRADHTPPATYAQALGTCTGGANGGEQCRNNNDCPDSSCEGNNLQYTSWLARNMWSAYADCYDDNSCPGMEGL